MPSSPEETQAAVAAAIKAGKLLRNAFVNGSEVKSAAGRDIKLDADVKAEEAILAVLRERTDCPVLSEEAGPDKGLSHDERHWVIDPLDGTFNFSRGIPLCCVSIGLMEHGHPVLGVIYDFMSDTLYKGGKGLPALANEAPLRSSRTRDISQAAVCTGFPLRADYGTESLLGVAGLATRFKKVRMLGSAATSLSMVARGSMDAYVETGISLWDVAAGIAIVEAAGGRVMFRPVGDHAQLHVVATNGELRPEAIDQA